MEESRGIETDLDALSNSVLAAMLMRKYDEAETICQRLLLEHPEVIDGHVRLGDLRDAQGRFQEAAKHYSKALEMMSQQPRWFDQETVEEVTSWRDQVLAKAKK